MSRSSVTLGGIGGDQIQESEISVIRAQAADISSKLTTIFSNVCRTGSVAQAQKFLRDRAAAYQNAMQLVKDTLAQVQQSNQQLQNTLESAAELTHVVHGLANATESILGVFAGSSVAVTVLTTADDGISAYNDATENEGNKGIAVIGAVSEDVRDAAIDQIEHEASKQAAKTLKNIVTRDRKYQGALQNAEVRYATQKTVANMATGVSVLFAVKGAVDGFSEAADGFKSLTASRTPKPIAMLGIPPLTVPGVSSR